MLKCPVDKRVAMRSLIYFKQLGQVHDFKFCKIGEKGANWWSAISSAETCTDLIEGIR